MVGTSTRTSTYLLDHIHTQYLVTPIPNQPPILKNVREHLVTAYLKNQTKGPSQEVSQACFYIRHIVGWVLYIVPT